MLLANSTPADRQNFYAGMPLSVKVLWRLVGKRQYAKQFRLLFPGRSVPPTYLTCACPSIPGFPGSPSARGWDAAFGTGVVRVKEGQSGRGERASASLTQQSLRFVMINRTPRDLLPASGTKRMRDGYLRGALSPQATPRQMDVLAAYVAAGGSVQEAAKLVGIRPSTD